MTLKSCFRKPFRGLFVQSLKRSVWIPLLISLERFLHTFMHSGESYDGNLIGFFWSDYLEGIWLPGYETWTLPCGILTAVILFNFAWSKKQTNVIFSLGMTRTEIYLAKLLAGIVPYLILLPLAAGFEVFACSAVGYRLTLRYFSGVAFTLLTPLLSYIMVFCVSSTVISNTGNIVEGGVFSLITLFSPSALKTLIDRLVSGFTLGASGESIEIMLCRENSWNWYIPFQNNFNVRMSNYYELGEAKSFFEVGSLESITLYDWSGAIMCAVYAVLAGVIGIILFRKKKNEYADTFGRTKIFNEFCAATVGIILMGLPIFDFDYGESNIFSFLKTLPFFFIGYFVFKFIFSYKKLKVMKSSLIRIPLYLAGLFAFLGVCCLGGAGYAAYIPDVEKIEHVKITSPFFANLDDGLAKDSPFGTRPLNIRDDIYDKHINLGYHNLTADEDTYQEYDFPEGTSYTQTLLKYSNLTLTFSSADDIALAVDVHKALIDDGHVTANGKDTQGTSFIIEYTLKDGTTVTREYYRTTEETAKKILKLNDTQAADRRRAEYFGDYTNNYSYGGQNENYDYISDFHKFTNISLRVAYLFPTDMSKGYCINFIESDLFDAILTDLEAQSSDEHYHHTADDEIGVIAFMPDSMAKAYPKLSEELSKKLGDDYITLGWNLNPISAKCIVITSDMVNTVRYLEENGLIKYFENYRTVDDISYVKLATADELFGKKNKHLNIPIFYGAYSIVPTFSDNPDSRKLFNKIKTKIEDKEQIEALLDEAVIFGYCSNSDRIMEITYTDGVKASVLVRTAR